MKIKDLIKRLIVEYQNRRPILSYGQNGEDLILNRLLSEVKKGFYVDIGAHHPIRFSNTYLFYKKGWEGINIDATPKSMDLFYKFRPRDTNIEVGIGLKSGFQKFYKFNEPALNTFCGEEAQIKNKYPYQLIDTLKINVERLENVLESNLTNNQNIDFMNIDVECKEEEVIKSNNWLKFRPKLLHLEILENKISNHKDSSIINYLSNLGYQTICKLYNSYILEDRKNKLFK